MTKKEKSEHEASLRETAEERLRKTHGKAPLPRAEDVPKMVHELEVHQAELEIQNEELRHSEAELTDSRNSYEELYDFAPVGYLTLDSEGRILRANLTTEKMIGIERSRFVRHVKFSSLVSPGSQDIWHKYRLEVLECMGKKAACELDVVKADKSLLSVSLETICIPAASQKKPLLMMAMIDITERKKAEEALRDSEERYRRLFETANEGIMTADLSGEINLANEKMAAMLGYTVEELIGKPGIDLLAHEDMPLANQLIEKRNIGDRNEYEIQLLCKDGSKRWFSVSGAPLRDSDGSHIGNLAMYTDITESKKAEEALKKSNEMFSRAEEIAKVGSWEWDLRSGNLVWSEQIYRIFGVVSGQFIPTHDSFLSIIHPDDRKSVEEMIENAISEKKPYDVEYRIVMPDSSEKWIYARGEVAFSESGQPKSMIGTAMDITERKRAEEALGKSYEMLSRAEEIAKVGSWERDVQSGKITWSQQIYRMLEMDPGQFFPTFDSFLSIIHPEDRKGVFEVIEASTEEKKPYEAEYRIVMPDSSEKWMYARGEAVYTESGRPKRMIGTVMDITERKKAEEEHRLRAAELEAVLDAQIDVVIEYDITMNVRRANPAFRTIFGFDPVGFNVKDIIKNVSCRSLDGSPLLLEEQPTPRALRGEKVKGQTFIVSRADGTEGVVETSSNPLWSEGRIAGSVTVWHDITERKQAEESLRAAQARTAAILEGIADTYYSLDDAWRFTVVNPAAEKAPFGRPASELLGKVIWDLYPGLLGTPIYRHYLDAAEKHTMEYYFSQSPLNGRWYEVFMQGREGGVDVYMRDITVLKLAEEALRESEERFRTIAETIPALVCITRTEDSVVLFTNEYNNKAFGLCGEEIIGTRGPNYYCDPADRAKMVDIFKKEGVVNNFPLKVKKSDGTPFWIMTSIRPIMYNGKPAMIGSSIDITENKKIEEALRESEQKERERAAELSVLLEAIPTPVFIVHDPESIHMTGNRAADLLLKIPPKTEVSLSAPEGTKPLHFIAVKDGRELKLDELPAQRAARGEEIRDFEFSLMFTDGTIRHVLGYGSPLLNEKGQPRGAVHVLVDITGRKKAEETLQRINRELEQFAYIASHDLQEPLRSVVSFSQLLARRYSDRIDETANEYIGFIIKGATHMESLIHDLLKFSRVGRMNIERSFINCNTIIDMIIAQLKKSGNLSDAEISRSDLPVLFANETSISQLFQNLMANAVKFRNPDLPPRVAISAENRNREWIFSVKDNGIGINPQYFDKIFVIFQRLNTKEEYPGTGIGLAICKKIVESYGGRIWVESTEGEGATFYFTFPV